MFSNRTDSESPAAKLRAAELKVTGLGLIKKQAAEILEEVECPHLTQDSISKLISSMIDYIPFWNEAAFRKLLRRLVYRDVITPALQQEPLLLAAILNKYSEAASIDFITLINDAKELLPHLKICMQIIVEKEFSTLISDLINKFSVTQLDETIFTPSVMKAIIIKKQDATLETLLNNFSQANVDMNFFTPAILYDAAEYLSDAMFCKIIAGISNKTFDIGMNFSYRVSGEDDLNTSLLIQAALFKSEATVIFLLDKVHASPLNNWLVLVNHHLKKTNFHILMELLDINAARKLLELMDYLALAEILLTHLQMNHQFELLPIPSIKNKSGQDMYPRYKGELAKKTYFYLTTRGIDKSMHDLLEKIHLKDFVLKYMFSFSNDELLKILHRSLQQENILFKFFDIQTSITAPTMQTGSFKKIHDKLDELIFFELLGEIYLETKENDAELENKTYVEMKAMAAVNPKSLLGIYIELAAAILAFNTDYRPDYRLSLSNKTRRELQKSPEKGNIASAIKTRFPLFYKHFLNGQPKYHFTLFSQSSNASAIAPSVSAVSIPMTLRPK